MPKKPRNIVICCDGTGNEIEAGAQSNVLELYQRLVKDPELQLTYYDPGLGTVAAPGFQTKTAKLLTKIAGLAVAYGLTTNIREAYTFLMQNYEEGDKIYLFGFSRGAYTVRALGGLIFMCGLLNRNSENLVDYAIQLHREKSGNPWKVAARFRKYFPRHWDSDHADGAIHFVGVWNTVKSVGLLRNWAKITWSIHRGEIV